MGYGFALILALMVSIADVKLPAEMDNWEVEGRLAESISVDSTFSAPGLPAAHKPEVSDLSAAFFFPYGEPEMYPFEMIVHEAAGRYDIDPDLLLAVIMAESRFNPIARSRKGAKGLMQLMPNTADALDVENIYSPEENVKAGARHLKWLLGRFDGNVMLALAAYNAGLKTVLAHDGIPPFEETRSYVSKVMEYYAAIKSDTLDF